MVGTVSLYDAGGERQHTIYIGATPEYGKAIFLEREEARNPAHQSPLSPSDLYWHCRRGSLQLAISQPSYQRTGSRFLSCHWISWCSSHCEAPQRLNAAETMTRPKLPRS